LATRIFLGEFLDLDHAKIAVIGLGYVGLPLGSPACDLAIKALDAVDGGPSP
jgi:UDP-N-acetyl-D-mannosaminuronate dehydrogenase